MNKKKVKKDSYVTNFFLILWGIFFTFSSLIALDPQKAATQYKQDTWQAEHGLGQNSVFAIHQNSSGYIWLGTLNGLVRFDGSRFKTFNKGNTQLQDNNIRALLEDRAGNLWIGTWEGGLSRLKDGEIKTHTLEDCSGLKEIYAIFQDREGILWVGTSNSGLTRLKNGKFTIYTTDDGLASNKVRAFHQDKDGRLWIGTSAGLSIRELSGKFTVYAGRNGPFDKYITSMFRRKNGELWLGCLDGLYHLKNDAFTHFGKADGRPDPKITCLYEDSDENLWAGTEISGLMRVKNGKFETFSPGDGLASGHICSIHEDRENNLWIGIFEKGLYRLRDSTFVPYTTREGLSHDVVNCITEVREGSLRLGTKKGVNRLNNGQLTREWTTKEGLLSNNVTAIIEDGEGTLWLGTETGLNLYKDGKIRHFNYKKGILNSYISQLWDDKKGGIWILTPGNLSLFYKGKLTVILNKEEVSNCALICFFIDREGSIWIGTHGSGLFRQKEGKRTIYTTDDGLVHNEVESIYEDKKGNLYIGTRGGLSLLNNGKFTKCTTRSGLIDSYIYHILEDELGYLWLSGITGPSRISKEELSDFAKGKIKKINPILFNQSDGMNSLICNSCIKTGDGKLWFATGKGLAMVDPSNIKKNTQAPSVVLEEVIVDGAAFYVGGIQPRYREDSPLVIPPGTKRLEFYYTGLSFVKSRQIKFKTKLEGYDKDWREMGNVRNTDYTNLPPREYTFKVKACNSDGVCTNEKDAASVSFYLKPHFYQTKWFYIFCALVAISTGFIGYRLRVRQLKTRQKELAAMVESRTREVEDKNRQLEDQSEKLKEMDKIKSRFFANISHEFRTPITLLLGPLEQMIADCNENETKRKLTLMLRNAQRLLRLINQLLELSKLESGKMKLQTSKTNIVSFIKGITASFQLLTQQKEMNLVFHADTDTENISLYIDPRKMEDIMSNLLINAVKFTPPGGEIRVTVKKNSPKDSVEISVSDTGPGIPVEQLEHIFDRFYQADATYEHNQKGSGIGLALTKELVELHNGTIEAKSQEGEGSTFIIHLPPPNASAPDKGVPFHDKEASAPDKGVPALGMILDEEENGSEIEMKFDLEPGSGSDEPCIILVVEDNADMRDYIKGALEPGFTVVGAKDGGEGIQKAREIIPDLIVSDIMMPGTDGYELCRTLKNDVQTSHIPIILLTAKASEENILEGLETRADDYITKPFSTKILSARIKNLIDIRNQLQQNINREMTLKPVKTVVSTIDREFLRDLQGVIKKNLSEPEFNVEELCRKLYMSNTTLYRKILALCGQTPTEFIRSCRLKRAAQLLKSGFGSVTEVAFEVGFSSRTYFTKCFKEKFQQLPSSFASGGPHAGAPY